MRQLNWQKSSFSGGDVSNNCLEIARGSGSLRYLRESDDLGAIVTTDEAKLRAFLLAAKAKEFDHLL